MSSPKPFLRAAVPILAGAGIVLTLAGAGAAPAQASTPDPLPAQLKHCASLTVADARLACYDALAGSTASNQAAPPPAGSSAATAGVATVGHAVAVGSMSASEASGASQASQASSASPAKTDMEFGVHNGALEAKLISPKREKRLLAVVSNISNRARGELVVTLDNGQVWVQLEPATYPLKPGDHVEIDVGALGSYVLWAPSIRRATKVTRIS